jgi:hypothetical protein
LCQLLQTLTLIGSRYSIITGTSGERSLHQGETWNAKSKKGESYKETIRQVLYTAIGDSFNQENNRGFQELERERRHAIQLIAEEHKAAIRKIVAEEKQAIWAKLGENRKANAFNLESIKEEIAKTYDHNFIENSGKDTRSPDSDQNPVLFSERVELEILPPRDQIEIDGISNYMKSLPEIQKVELITLTDKSYFNVFLRQSADITGKLMKLPQITKVEEVVNNGHKIMRITLLAASKNR